METALTSTVSCWICAPRWEWAGAVREELPHHGMPGSLPDLMIEPPPVPRNAVTLGMAAFARQQFLTGRGRPVRRGRGHGGPRKTNEPNFPIGKKVA